jgi:DNA polymerase delta subunit 2
LVVIVIADAVWQVLDVLSQCKSMGGSEVEALTALLELRHLAPTAPATLDCYPFKRRDPFVIAGAPRVLFAGNQAAFGAKLVGPKEYQTLVLSVPTFAETGIVTLVDMSTLEATTIRFDAP